MELTQLRYFAEIARCEHMTQAAEKLNISQPALSHAMKSLEQELGVHLFKHSGRNITLTPYGKSFYQNVRRIFAELQNAERERRELTLDLDRLYIGTNCPDLIDAPMTEFLSARNHPLRLRHLIDETERFPELLEECRVDISLLETDETKIPGTARKITDINLFAVVDATNPIFADSEEIMVQALQNIAKITSTSSPNLMARLDNIFMQNGLPRNNDIQVSTPDKGLRLAALGYGAFIATGPVLADTLQSAPHLHDSLHFFRVTGKGCSWALRSYVSEYAEDNLVVSEFEHYLCTYFEQKAFRQPDSILAKSKEMH